jgi:hypothetical protein
MFIRWSSRVFGCQGDTTDVSGFVRLHDFKPISRSATVIIDALFGYKDNVDVMHASTEKAVKQYLQTTAKYIGSTHKEIDPYSILIQQGSGLIQVFNAIHYSTEVSPSEILLNDIAHWNGL